MRYFLSLMVALLFAASGCSPTAEKKSGGEETGKGKIQIVCTIAMVGDVVKQVVGDKAEVEILMGPGVDPHLHKATRSDRKAIKNAQIVFYSGLMLEGKMMNQLSSRGDKVVVPVTESIPESTLLEPPEFEGHFDPHVWMDVSAWSQTVDVILDVMSEFDPDNKSYYEANAKAYKAELEKLHNYAKKTIGSIPEESRVLVTAHDAFNYFARAYGIEVKGIQGISTTSEASVKRINELVDMLVKRKVKAVFVESSVPKKHVDSLIEGAKARGWDVTIGGELFSDAMGKGNTYRGTYVGMIDHNVTTITEALGGDVVHGGMNHKLEHDHSAH